MNDMRYGELSIRIINYELLEEVFKEDLSSGEPMPIKAVFNDFILNYIAESHIQNYVYLVELITD